MSFEQGLILLLLGVVIGGGIENRRRKWLDEQLNSWRRALEGAKQISQEEDEQDQ